MLSLSILRPMGLVLLLLSSAGLLEGAECPPPPAIQAKIQKSPGADAYLEAGNWFGNRKNFLCAAEAYQKALTFSPNSAKIPYLLGLSLFSAGKYEDAIAPLKQSLEIDPTRLKPHIIFASALDRLNRKGEAKEQWQAALKLDPKSAEARQGLANDLADEGDFGTAISLLRSPSPTPDSAQALAQIYVRLNMLNEASEVLQKALAANPSSVKLGSALVSIEIKQLHLQAAEKLCGELVRKHPSDPDLQRLYLQTVVLTSNSAVARPLAKKLLAASPNDFQLLYINGVLDHDAGDSKSAREHLEHAIAIDPQVAAAHFNLGTVLAALNDPRGAKEHFEKAIELGGTEPEIHFQLGKVLHILGENEKANEELKLYQQGLREKNQRSLAASKQAQADKALEANDPKQAIALYQEALEATPEDALLDFKLAVALDRAGDIPTELTVLEKAIQVNPDLASAQNQLGFLASRRGDPAEAEKHFREAVRAAPAFTEAWVNLAASLGMQSKYPEAQKAVAAALALEPQNPQALLLKDTLAKVTVQP